MVLGGCSWGTVLGGVGFGCSDVGDSRGLCIVILGFALVSLFALVFGKCVGV